jgi:hypothetical protein
MIEEVVKPVDTLTKYLTTFGPIIAAGATLIVAFLVQNRYNQKVIRQKQREDERKEIFTKLKDFYGPLQRLRGKSNELHTLFKNGRNFRTLIKLLEGEGFSGNDRKLLDSIIEIGKRTDNLILTEGGWVEDPGLRKMLDKVTTHYTLIELAAKGELTGDEERFKNFVFPNEIDGEIEREMKRLNDRLSELDEEILQESQSGRKKQKGH